MDWEQRVISILASFGLTTTVITVWRYRGRKDVANVLRETAKQLSFVVCGPAIWWTTNLLPHDYSSLLLLFTTDWFPLLASLRVLLDLQQAERRFSNTTRSSSYRRDWAKLFRRDSRYDRVPELLKLKKLTISWLAYWSCWPVLRFLVELNMQDDWIPAVYKASYDGVMMAFVLWCMLWGGCRVLPYVLRLGGSCIDGVLDSIGAALSNVRSLFLGKAWEYSGVLRSLSQHVGTLAVVGVVALTILAITYKVFQVVSAVLVIIIVIGTASESARYASFEGSSAEELCRKRLAFWVMLLLWIQATSIPGVGIILDIWTPLVLVASLVAGDKALHFVIGLLLSAISLFLGCVVACLRTEDAEGGLSDIDEGGLSDSDGFYNKDEDSSAIVPPVDTTTSLPVAEASTLNEDIPNDLQEPLLKNVDDEVQSEHNPVVSPRVHFAACGQTSV